jgi:glyoxylase-like metal-dependent hydrolase (beta-lactamase superfamily II)
VRKIATALVLFVLVGAPTYWWFFLESAEPVGTFALDLAELRTLADSMEGDKPSAIRVEHVAGFEYPATAVFAGNGWAPVKMPVYSYQLVFPNRTAVVDTAMDEQTAKTQQGSFFDAAAFSRTLAGIEKAEFIVITHEHFDHLGGASTHPKAEAVAHKLKLTKAQLADVAKQKPLRLSDAVNAKVKPLEYDRALAVAPGVVLWKAPGHTPGSQMIYVKRADGEEYLFLGDIAWHQANWQQVHERARLVTQFFLGEDRDAVLRELAAIKALAASAPALHVSPGHDGAVIDALLVSGAMTAQFQPD